MSEIKSERLNAIIAYDVIVAAKTYIGVFFLA
jgi:hypothetical protein